MSQKEFKYPFFYVKFQTVFIVLINLYFYFTQSPSFFNCLKFSSVYLLFYIGYVLFEAVIPSDEIKTPKSNLRIPLLEKGVIFYIHILNISYTIFYYPFLLFFLIVHFVK